MLTSVHRILHTTHPKVEVCVYCVLRVRLPAASQAKSGATGRGGFQWNYPSEHPVWEDTPTDSLTKGKHC